MTERIQSGEIESRSKAGADDGGKRTTPKVKKRAWAGSDATEGGEKGGRMGLLETGFQEVGGLEEECREDPGGKTSQKMKR